MGKRRKRREKAKQQEDVVIHEQPVQKRSFGIKEFYEKKYKALMIIPFVMLIAAIIVIAIYAVQTGEVIPRGVSLKGGLTITMQPEHEIDLSLLSATLSQYKNDFAFREITEGGQQKAITIEVSLLQGEDPAELEQQLLSSLEAYDIETYSSEIIGPSLGSAFFRQTSKAVIAAFILMSIIVFVFFRSFAPSAAVVLAAVSDIIVTVAVVDIIGMKISSAGIAAFLMLIGYSVDTDILLSTRVLKRKEGSVFDRVLSALTTGMTMTITTIAAVSVAILVTESDVIRQIMIIILIGLIVDIINTWLQNAGILRWYMEKKGERL